MSNIKNILVKILKKRLRIVISGLSGCGNTTICKKLAEILGIKCINYTFRNLAKEKNIDIQELILLSEKSDIFDTLVDTRQKDLVSNAPFCVVGSRLAIWLIHDADVKIYLKVKKSVRYNRIQQRENKSIGQVIEETSTRDTYDIERYKRIYDIDIADYDSAADAIIYNNGKNYESTIETIMSILKQKSLISY